MADGLVRASERLTAENVKDVEAGKKAGLSSALIDRLTLNPKRIEAMAQGIREIVYLPDPVGEVLEMRRRPNGMEVGRVRVPIGLIGIIYESRPNVTADTSALCLKSGNAVLLRGGSEAIHSEHGNREGPERSRGRRGRAGRRDLYPRYARPAGGLRDARPRRDPRPRHPARRGGSCG